MTADLHEMLDRAVPEPPGRLDPDAVLRRARRRQATRRMAVAGGSLAVVGVLLGTGLTVTRDDTARYADVPLRVSALDDAAPLGEVARGASGVERGTVVAEVPVEPESDVVLYEDEDLLCVMTVSESYGGAGTACFAWDQLLDRGVLMIATGLELAPKYLVVVAPDGYTEATVDGRTFDVISNVAVVEVPSDDVEVTISGPDVPDRTFAADEAETTMPRSQRLQRDAGMLATLQEVRALAVRYQQENGSLAGFAESLRPNGATRRMLREVSDTRAVAEVEDGCLVMDLATGAVGDAPCR